MTPIHARRAQAEDRQQQAVRASAPLFIRACPGAGKTKVLVERHCLTPPGPRRAGRALLSFTNVASDELRNRCSGSRPDLAAYPHFIGTFDSFLWRYLVRPFLPAAPPWQHVLSWDQVPAALVGPRRVPLSAFRFSYDPTTRQTQVQWPTAARSLVNSQLSEADYLRLAERRRDDLWQTRGYMTGHEIRIAALDHVRNPAVTSLLRHRFFEIVVDEAQDCSELDLTILGQFHRAGLPLVIVADTDQGIYEWNDARPQDLTTFTQHLTTHLDLNGNWRSSPPVCRLAATLRPTARSIPDDPVGDRHDQASPLLLLPYGQHKRKTSGLLDVSDASEAFVGHAAYEGIAAADCLAVAYRNDAVPKARSRPAPHLPKGTNAKALAWAAAVFTAAEAPTAARKHALTIASTLLNDYWHPDTDETLADSLATHNITPALMRRRAARFLTALPPLDATPARDWRSTARAVLKAQLPPSGDTMEAPKILSLGAKELDTPIDSLVGMPQDEDLDTPAAAMRSSTIHQAKGSEADAVLIHLPKPQSVTELLNAWADPLIHTENDELLRTYYVAITRARRFVALTYPMSKHDEAMTHLDSLKIEYRTQTAHPTASVVPSQAPARPATGVRSA
ncbi:UvrD-helicase domain-containing protein [Streptomyces chartreusis]|uniref:UvrD-helicase domain-containing protein n=1 Tax=Streptomyces chartreusis TaxID=1969 RepID=UPI0036FB6485